MGRAAALVPAAGRGERLGPGTPKALRLLGNQPMLVHAVHSLAASGCVDLVVIAAPEGHVDEVEGLFLDPEFGAEVIVVAGGEERQDSVARALLALPDDVDVVLVHDAARPLVPSDVVAKVVATVRAGHPVVIPALPVVDTIKQVDADEFVQRTVDRSRLRAIQTPQGFERSVLQRAHAETDPRAQVTDDASLAEMLGQPVLVIAGHEEAFKVTRPLDIVLAEAVLARRRSVSGI